MNKLIRYSNNTGAFIYNGLVGGTFLLTDMIVVGINNHTLRELQLNTIGRVPYWKFIAEDGTRY